MAIEKINFSYPKGSLQSVYDVEEMTALELAAKTSKKVDECVDLVNGVEQSAIEATAIVENMMLAQDQFMTENNDIRQTLVTNNQDFITVLTTEKDTFIGTLTTAKAGFELSMQTSLDDFEESVLLSKETFETQMTQDIAGFDVLTTAALSNFTTEKTTALGSLTTSLNAFSVEADTAILDVQTQATAIAGNTVTAVNTKIDAMALDGSLGEAVGSAVIDPLNLKIDKNSGALASMHINVKYPPTGLTAAVGDVIANDTAALQAIIDYAPDHSTIYFPKGFYKITASLVIDKPLIIQGAGRMQTAIHGIDLGYDVALFDIKGTIGQALQNFKLKGMFLYSNNNQARGLTLEHVNMSIFEDIYLYNLAKGIYSLYGWSNVYKDIVSYGILYNTVLLGDQCNNVLFDHVSFVGERPLQLIGGMTTLDLQNCDFENQTNTADGAITLTPAAGKIISNVKVSNCYFERIQGFAIRSVGTDANSIINLVVENCYFFGGYVNFFASDPNKARFAFVMVNTTNFKIKDCRFVDWKTSMFFRTAEEKNGVIEGNYLDANLLIANDGNFMTNTVKVLNNTVGHKEYISDAIPVTTNATKGDIVLNSLAVTQNYLGWVCVSVVPDVWKPYGAIVTP